jgi:hypothetical protein
MVMFEINLRLIAVKFNRFTREECGPFPVFAGYILAFAAQLRVKVRKKNLSQRIRKVQVGHDSMCQKHSLLHVPRTNCRSRSPFFREAGSTLGQRNLPSCLTKGFHTSAKLESNLSVRDMACLAKKGTPKSS